MHSAVSFSLSSSLQCGECNIYSRYESQQGSCCFGVRSCIFPVVHILTCIFVHFHKVLASFIRLSITRRTCSGTVNFTFQAIPFGNQPNEVTSNEEEIILAVSCEECFQQMFALDINLCNQQSNNG